jgi:hypothetical protein
VRKKDFTIGNGATCRVRFSIQALISEIAVAQDLDIKLAFYPSGSSRLPSRRPPNHIFFIMAVLSRFLQLTLALLATATATPIERRGTIASDEIVGFAQTVPSGTVGSVYLAYKPYLYVYNGCVPFPAVDAAGDTKYVPSNSKMSRSLTSIVLV